MSLFICGNCPSDVIDCVSCFSVVTSNTLTKCKREKGVFTVTYPVPGETVDHGREGMAAGGRGPPWSQEGGWSHFIPYRKQRETRRWDYTVNIKVHLQLYTSSSEVPPPKHSTTFSNSTTSWGSRVHTCKPMGIIIYSNHKFLPLCPLV